MATVDNPQTVEIPSKTGIMETMDGNEDEYVTLWPAGKQHMEPPPRQEVQGNFNISTTQTLRVNTEKNVEYAAVNKGARKSESLPTPSQQTDRTLFGPRKLIDVNDSVIDFNIFLLETENDKVRGIVELSTMNKTITSKVRTRVVCLFDVSGSMLLKCGRSKQESKITKLKKAAFELINSFNDSDEDYFGLVTFGDVSKIIVPLTKVDAESKISMTTFIEKMNEFSYKTDLSEGLKTAIKMLHETHPKSRSMYRNVIMVFSDGEINKGTIQPDVLVHEVREQIRSAKPDLELQSDQWVNIACITTGGNVSEAIYMLSKFCGNDAYYYIDSKVKNPEINMMIPFMLRKYSVAQSITVNIVPAEGIEINQRECSQEHSLRRKRQSSANQTMSYYLHDFPSQTQKHFSLTFEVDSNDIGKSDHFLNIELEYIDNDGNIRSVEKEITFKDVKTEYDDALTLRERILLLCKTDMRMSMQASCRKSADIFKNSQNNAKLSGNPVFILEEGKREIANVKDKYIKKTNDLKTKQDIQNFEAAVQANLDALIETMNKSLQGNGHKWTKLKAVSSSIVRETPNVSQLVVHSQIVCPLPKLPSTNSASDKLAALAEKVSAELNRSDSEAIGSGKLFGAASTLGSSLTRMIQSTLDRSTSASALANFADGEDCKADAESDAESDEEK